MRVHLKNFSLNLLIVLILSTLFINCGSSKTEKLTKSTLKSDLYKKQFTGILVIDTNSRDTLISYNSNKYFTPASNVKIFTLYTGIKLLGKNLPAFKYYTESDTICLVGTGDPTFLHPYFNDSTALKKIKNFKVVNLLNNNFVDEKFGPGWAWEDYDSYFSPERSGFPIFGNVLCINCKSEKQITPSLLADSIVYVQSNFKRVENNNRFFVEPNIKSVEIPLKLNDTIFKKLWEGLTPNKIEIINSNNLLDLETAFSIPSDSLYKRMMHKSDNFLAEQILIMSSSSISDSLSTKIAIDWMTKNALQDLKDPPRWVDGSGLSRYNLFTPESFVHVLDKLYKELPKNRLYTLFPSIDNDSTTVDFNIERPYLYAKSGSLGNNYNLSGYLITNSNKTLIFSFMNNHFVNASSKVKAQLINYLRYLRDNY